MVSSEVSQLSAHERDHHIETSPLTRMARPRMLDTLLGMTMPSSRWVESEVQLNFELHDSVIVVSFLIIMPIRHDQRTSRRRA